MNFIKKNKLSIIFFLIGLGIGLLIMSFQIKKRNVPLEDNYTLISLDKEKINSDEYYELLKNNTGIELLLELIDDKLLSKMYPLTDQELDEIKNNMNETINSYKEYYGSEEEFLTQNGFKNKEKFYEYLILEYKRTLYEKDYLNKTITNQEINNYYLNTLTPDFEIMYIKGNNKILEEILTLLNNGQDKEEIIKKYQKQITYQDLGYISFDNKEINEDIYNDSLYLDDNTYTDSIRSINNEYYLIFRGKTNKKDDINNLRDRIKQKIIEQKMNNDTDNILFQEILINLRKENNIVINDTYLNNLYNAYIKSLK